MYNSTLIPNGMLGRLEQGGSASSMKDHGYRIESGTTVEAIDGQRLVYSACMSGIVYIQVTVNPGSDKLKGLFYDQTVMGFENDTGKLSGTAGRLNVKLAATKSVISDFMDIYKGVLTVAGGPLAISITGMDMLVAAGKLKQNYGLYSDALEAFVDDDMELRRLMPVFYDHMFVELYLGRIESDLTGSFKEKAVKGVIKNKAVAQIVGVFIGKVGENAMTRILKGMSKIIKEVLFKVIEHKLIGKPLSEDQVELLAKHHIVPMYDALSRVPMRMDRAKAMIREAYDKAAAVKPRLQKIAKAIDALAG